MMKKHLIYFLGVILALGLTNCSSDDNDMNDGIELSVQLTIASNMQTRTPRPLEGVNNWQHVTDVRVFIFRSDTKDGDFTLYQPEFLNEDGDSPLKEYYIDVPAFNKTEVHTEEEFETHSLIIKPKLPNGFYRLLAIGIDEEENTKLFENLNLHVGTKWQEVLKTANDTPISNEFFSGFSDIIEVSPSISRNYIKIEMKRCVAGVLLYVTNIPSKYNDETGQIPITSIKLLLSGFNQTTDIVNRNWVKDETAIPNEMELVNFSSANAINDENSAEKGCYYAGSFLLPSNTSNLENPTLKLMFYNGEDSIRSKKVKLITTYDGDFDYENLKIDRFGHRYNILANHLYCLGFRSEEKKEPIDLGKVLENESDEVKIIVYGSWQADIDITL